MDVGIFNWKEKYAKKMGIFGITIKDGGERGIRTLGATFGSTHDFQSCSFSQLGHLSAMTAVDTIPCNQTSINMTYTTFAGGEDRIRTCGGREPPTVFETAAFNHSATSPEKKLQDCLNIPFNYDCQRQHSKSIFDTNAYFKA